ncbi:MAG: ParB/RepB/Spo0J family partition protein [Candidatus Magasanikbacteria bacterium]|nr:ParB/RepB/Spo0J family partition protein [Candidatus Magasanikbacteria bacterium]
MSISTLAEVVHREDVEEAPSREYMVPVARIVADPKQGRKRFTEEAIQQMADSIEADGLISAVVLKPAPDHAETGLFMLVAGETRWRAHVRLGRKLIRAVIRVADPQSYMIGLVENLVRTPLNPIEEAHAFQQAIDEGGFTQGQLGKKVGRSQGHICKRLDLLKLPEDLQEAVADDRLKLGVAEVLIRFCTTHDAMRAALRELNNVYHGMAKISVKGAIQYFQQLAERALRAAAAEARAEGDQPLTDKPEDLPEPADLEWEDDDHEDSREDEETRVPDDEAATEKKRPDTGHPVYTRTDASALVIDRPDPPAFRPSIAYQSHGEKANARISRVASQIKREGGLPGTWPSYLLDLGEIEAYRRRAHVYRQGADPEDVFLLLSGRVVREYENGEYTGILDVHGSGEILGDMYCGTTKYTETILTLDPGVLIRVPSATFWEKFQKDPGLRSLFWGRLGGRAQRDALRASLLANASAETRLRYLFFLLATRFGVEGDSRGRLVSLDLTRQRLGELTGMTLETVIRVMGRIKEAGVISDLGSGRGFMVHDMARLRPSRLDS